MTCDHEAQIRDLLEEREELLTEIRRLQRGNHPAGRALREATTPHDHAPGLWCDECPNADELRALVDRENYWRRTDAHNTAEKHRAALALTEALTERDAEHEGGGGA